MVNAAPHLSVEGLCLDLPGFSLREISFSVMAGEYFVLLGPTGSGKTLLMECLCGLRRPTAGSIRILGRDVGSVDPARRNIGYVPQDFALLPFRTVRGNLSFGLEARRMNRAQRRTRTDEIMEMLGLGPLADRYPAGLSGGERQRVALGRALAIRPALLVLDEPFSAIDEELREDLGRQIRGLQQRLNITALHICHSLEEADRLADRLGILRAGSLVQVGLPEAIWRRPRDARLARFIRSPNRLDGEVSIEDGLPVFRSGGLTVSAPGFHSGPAVALLPPDRIEVLSNRPPADSARLLLDAAVLEAGRSALQPCLRVRLDPDAEVRIPGAFDPAVWHAGRTVYLSLPRDSVHLMPPG